MGKKGKKKKVPAPAPAPAPELEAELDGDGGPKLSRAERRAQERDAAKQAKKKAPRVDQAAASAEGQKTRTDVAKSMWSTTDGQHDNGIVNPLTAEFQKRVADFLGLRHPTLEQVCELDSFMKKLQAMLAAEGEKANKSWLICSANLSHAVEPRKIFVFSQRAEEAKQRVLRFNSDVKRGVQQNDSPVDGHKAFNACRDKVYASPAHKEALVYMAEVSVTMPDGSVQMRSTMEEDASLADFDKLAYEMKAEGMGAGGVRKVKGAAGGAGAGAGKERRRTDVDDESSDDDEFGSAEEEEEDDGGFARLLAEMKAEAAGGPPGGF